MNLKEYIASPLFKWSKKDFLDQPLHFLMGMVPVLISGYLYGNIGMAVLISLYTIALLAYRELKQHLTHESKVILDLDLIVGIVGAIVGILISVVFF